MKENESNHKRLIFFALTILVLVGSQFEISSFLFNQETAEPSCPACPEPTTVTITKECPQETHVPVDPNQSPSNSQNPPPVTFNFSPPVLRSNYTHVLFRRRGCIKTSRDEKFQGIFELQECADFASAKGSDCFAFIRKRCYYGFEYCDMLESREVDENGDCAKQKTPTAYEITAEHLGCFKDKWEHVIPNKFSVNSVNECLKLAKDGDAICFGMQNGNECYFSWDSCNLYHKLGPTEGCENLSGGRYAMDAYRIITPEHSSSFALARMVHNYDQDELQRSLAFIGQRLRADDSLYKAYITILRELQKVGDVREYEDMYLYHPEISVPINKRMPDFFMFGTAKGGSSIVMRSLMDHPHLRGPKYGRWPWNNEIMFWTPFIGRCSASNNFLKALNLPQRYHRCSYEKYASHFTLTPSHVLLGDKNPAGISWPHLAEMFKPMVAEGMKLLVIFREPVSRMVSYYNWYKDSIPNSLTEYLHDQYELHKDTLPNLRSALQKMKKDTQSLSERYEELLQSWSDYSYSLCKGLRNFQTCETRRGIVTGIYLPGLVDWISRSGVGKENIQVLFYETFIENMNSTARNIWSWLGVDPHIGHVLPREKVMSGNEASNEELKPDEVASLKTLYNPWNEELRSFLVDEGYVSVDDLPPWLLRG